MTSTEFAYHVRYMTHTNSTTFTDADLLALMKVRQDELARAILKAGEDILLIPQTTALVASQREYPFPSDFLAKIKRVEAKLDGTNWIRLYKKEIEIIGYPLTESNITLYHTNLQDESFYMLSRKSIYLLSGTITSVSAGLKLWVNTYPSAIASLSGSTDMSVDPSTTTHGIPRELHEIWARGVIIDYKTSREKPIPLTERESSYEYDKASAIASLKPQDLDNEIIGHLPPANHRGNNGVDY